MADTNELSASEALILACSTMSDPTAWAIQFIEGSGFSVTDVDEWESIPLQHGLKLILVYEEGGHEGGGEHVERVFAIGPAEAEAKDGRVEGARGYIRTTGYYASDYGTEYDGEITDYGTEYDGEITTVEPREVMVTRYFAK